MAEILTPGATQLEIAALPYRSWQTLRRRIILLREAEIEMPGSGHLENGETIFDHLERNLSAASAFAFLISDYCSRQIPRNEKVELP